MAIAKKKKRFHDIEMPIIRKTTQLQAMEPSELEGRYIKYDLTRILRGKSIMLQLKVVQGKENLTTIPTEMKVMPYYIKRMVRKGSDYVEDSFSTECKDGKIKIKPLLVTRRRVSKAVRKALRVKAREELEKYAKSKNAERIFDEVLKNKLQKELSLKLKKIYPLSLCEIRVLKLEEFSGKPEEALVQETESPASSKDEPKTKEETKKEEAEEPKEESA